jgi:hypothetical protein
MARQKKNEPTDSTDSLLDALTNVVAVLIVVLLLLQIDIEQTVNKMFDELIPATPEQVELAKIQLKEAEAETQASQAMLEAPAPTETQLEEVRVDLSLLEKTREENKAKLIALEELTALAEKTEKEAEAEKKKTDARLVRIEELEALLDQTPRPEAQPATIVSIPDSRTIPNNSNIYYCFITGDQAHLVNPIAATEMVMKAFDDGRRDLTVERVRVRGERTRSIYDQNEVVALLARQEFKIRKQILTVPLNKTGTRLNLRIQLDPKQGDASLADMMESNGRFHRILDQVKTFTRPVLIFKVHPSGFATYLKAREIADQQNIACGWEVDSRNFLTAPLEIEVKRLETPPPPPPRPDTPLPPPPKRKLD